jgi:glucosamine-6-phosphate deaminase
MRFIVAKNDEELSQRAADLIAAQVILKPDCVLGLATGSSPIGTYDCLAKWYQEGRLDFSHVTSINLDEYQGLTPDNPQS